MVPRLLPRRWVSRSLFTTITLLAFVLAGPKVAHAAPISALTFTGSLPNGTSANTTRGYEFDVTTSDLVVTALSVWDHLGDGLATSHEVGLWDSSGTLMAFATVSGGTSATLMDGFRVVDIPDISLAIGSGYIVGAFFFDGSLDFQAYNLTGVSTASGITLVGGRFINSANTLTRPTTSFSNALVGGSLVVETASAPEPASILLLGTGLLGAGVRRWRQKRS